MPSRRTQQFFKRVAFPGVVVSQRPLKRYGGGDLSVPGKASEDAEGFGTGSHLVISRRLPN